LASVFASCCSIEAVMIPLSFHQLSLLQRDRHTAPSAYTTGVVHAYAGVANDKYLNFEIELPQPYLYLLQILSIL
jgi:hypothetical protein